MVIPSVCRLHLRGWMSAGLVLLLASTQPVRTNHTMAQEGGPPIDHNSSVRHPLPMLRVVRSVESEVTAPGGQTAKPDSDSSLNPIQRVRVVQPISFDAALTPAAIVTLAAPEIVESKITQPLIEPVIITASELELPSGSHVVSDGVQTKASVDAEKTEDLAPAVETKFLVAFLDDPLSDGIVPNLELIVSEYFLLADADSIMTEKLAADETSADEYAAEASSADQINVAALDGAESFTVATQPVLASDTNLVMGDLRAAWLLFEDPALQEMIQRVLLQNPGLREAQARIAQSRASFHSATADLFPQVTGTAQHGYRRFSQNGNAFVQDSNTTQGFDWYSSGFDTRWEVDLFGRLRSIRNAAGYEALAAEQSYRDVMVTLIGDLMLTYVEYAMATERIRIAIGNLRVQEDILRLTQELLRVGEDGQLAVAQAQTQVELTRASIPSFQEQRSVALHRLMVLQGIGARSFDVPSSWGQSLPALPAKVPSSIDCELLAQRPDVRSSRLLVSAQLERLGASKAEYYPKVFLNGSISLETRDPSEFWDEASLAHSVGPMVTLNLLDFGRIRAAINGERAKYEQSVARYQQSILEATEEVRNAMIGVERQRERAEALGVAAASARSVAEMARVEYREGLTNFQNVLDSERQVLSIEDQRAVAYGTALVSYAKLFKALGGVWYEASNRPFEPN
jgi:NodT family efflux transporter outer membrane factor (OMF) lipoprotein